MTMALTGACFAAAPLEAATVANGFSDAIFESGIQNATAMEFAPDGRLFVLQQTGQVRVVKQGTLLPTPFATLSVTSQDERGLLGIAFDPNFAVNQFVYFYHTVSSPVLRNRITRLTANGDVAAAGSATTIFEVDPLSSATNHNGGALHFGVDGKLYVAVGDNANRNNAPDLASQHGKILRINSNGTIPADNPFGGSSPVWARGLRNPYTFALQPGTGTLFINDVGENTWEEVNVGVAGANYGWPSTEGATSNPSFRSPLYAYPHSGATPSGCAISGGAFFLGRYHFADFCGHWIYSIDPSSPSTATLLASGISAPVDLKVGPDGALYYLDRGAGTVGVIRQLGGADVPIPLGALAALAGVLLAIGARRRLAAGRS
jgi:glucose/arabinose dehydrogenase